MKSKRRASNKKAQPREPESKSQKDTPALPDGAAVPVSSRKWLFRLLALTIIPLVCLGGLELALRLAGYGFPTSFFLRHRLGNREILVENDQFGRRFFPRQLVRHPAPVTLEAKKSPETYRIFVFGESAAMGDPAPSFSVSRILEVLLRERYPGTKFEVINTAFTAINSHVIVPIARECARHQGDLWIIYMGNNEVVGPFGPATVFGAASLDLSLIRASLILKSLKTGQLLEEVYQKLKIGAPSSNAWAGLQMFLENRIEQIDPRLQKVYGYFERNLRDILRAGEESGAKIIVSTVASNLKDCAPFASAQAARLGAEPNAAFQKNLQEGIKLESAGQWQEAIREYTKAAGVDPGFAEAPFRLGRCYLADNQLELARQCFERARDLDTLRFRADTQLNGILTKHAFRQESRGIYLVDAAETLARSCLDGIPGDELFLDHVHLSFEGNHALAMALAEQAARLLPAMVTPKDAGQWATPDFCARRLALTGWDRYQMYELMQRRLLEAPFTNQLNHAERQRRYLEKLTALKPAVQLGGLEQAASAYREALDIAPRDFHLHENFARLLNARGDLDGAIAQTKTLAELLPHNPAPYYNLGRFLDAQGQMDEAMKSFAQALDRRRDYPEAHDGMGQALMKQGRNAEARTAFTRALQLQPNFMEALLNLGELWQKEGQLQKAKESYGKALEIQPNSFAVQLHVGNLLVESGDLLGANQHFAECVRLQPSSAMTHFSRLVESRPQDPVAHYQAACAQAAQDRRNEAMQSLQEAIRLQPDFWEARYLLGVELALQNNLPEAKAQFSEVVRLQPGFARAHLNLGVALAKEMRLNEARQQFEETLRLDPTNKLAEQHLKTLQALQR